MKEEEEKQKLEKSEKIACSGNETWRCRRSRGLFHVDLDFPTRVKVDLS